MLIFTKLVSFHMQQKMQSWKEEDLFYLTPVLDLPPCDPFAPLDGDQAPEAVLPGDAEHLVAGAARIAVLVILFGIGAGCWWFVFRLFIVGNCSMGEMWRTGVARSVDTNSNWNNSILKHNLAVEIFWGNRHNNRALIYQISCKSVEKWERNKYINGGTLRPSTADPFFLH